jgi:segregation and condensation protein A
MGSFQSLNIEVAGEFLVMAANLLYIKSRTLLPKDQQMPEDDGEDDDPRWELIRQLIEYKKFKEAASDLRSRETLQGSLFPRFAAAPELLPLDNLLADEVGIFDLINAFQRTLKRLENRNQREDLREIFEENFTVSDKMDFLLQLISEQGRVRFEECFADPANRAEVVVTFLAVLELIRLKQLRARQEEHFGKIWIEPAALARTRPERTR